MTGTPKQCSSSAMKTLPHHQHVCNSIATQRGHSHSLALSREGKMEENGMEMGVDMARKQRGKGGKENSE